MSFRRRVQLSQPGLQLRAAAIAGGAALLGVLPVVWLVAMRVQDVASVSSEGADVVREGLSGLALSVFWVGAGVAVPLVMASAIYATHRIIGPLRRLEDHLRGIANGGPVQACAFREADELSEFADLVNRALAAAAKSTPDGEGAPPSDISPEERRRLFHAVS